MLTVRWLLRWLAVGRLAVRGLLGLLAVWWLAVRGLLGLLAVGWLAVWWLAVWGLLGWLAVWGLLGWLPIGRLLGWLAVGWLIERRLRHLCPLSVDALDSARTNCTVDGSRERAVAEVVPRHDSGTAHLQNFAALRGPS